MPHARGPTSRRRALSESQLLAVVEDSARDGSWNAAAWLLERRWPERWVKPSSRPTATPERQHKDGERDQLAEIIDLAKRRRE
jgi:hypothetical protein